MKTINIREESSCCSFYCYVKKRETENLQAIGFFEAMKPNRDKRKCNIFRNEKQIIFEANGNLEARDLMEIGGNTAFSWK